MRLDIDSFLDTVGKEEIEKPVLKEKEKISLEFQKDIENRIDLVKKDSKSNDLVILKEIYDEIKNFNVELPNKFLGIENKSGAALKELGEKYSDQFIIISKNNAQIIGKSIDEKIMKIREFLSNQDFISVLETYKQIISEFNFFPKSLFNEKIILSSKIKDIEISIFSELDKYRQTSLVRLRAQLNQKIDKINELFKERKLRDIEIAIKDLEDFSNHLPKVLITDLIPEKIKISNILKQSEQYLIAKYNQEFEYRLNLINKLSEKFHSFYLKKNVSECVITYDEIIVEFRTLPDFFIEKKVEIFKKINDLYTKLNKLILNRNILMFVETYEYSKRVEGIREYLKHVESTKDFNKNTLIEIKSKIETLPRQFEYDKEEFRKVIDSLVKRVPTNNQNNNDYFETISTKQNLINVDTSNSNYSHKIKVHNSSNFNNSRDIFNEIERLYEQFKLANEPNEIQKIYKKIIFQLNISNIEPNLKKNVIKKVNKTLHEKKLV